MNQLSETIETASFPAVAREFPGGRILAIIGRSAAKVEGRTTWKDFDPEIPVQTKYKLAALIESAKRLGIRRLQFRISNEAGENKAGAFLVNEL